MAQYSQWGGNSQQDYPPAYQAGQYGQQYGMPQGRPYGWQEPIPSTSTYGQGYGGQGYGQQYGYGNACHIDFSGYGGYDDFGADDFGDDLYGSMDESDQYDVSGGYDPVGGFTKPADYPEGYYMSQGSQAYDDRRFSPNSAAGMTSRGYADQAEFVNPNTGQMPVQRKSSKTAVVIIIIVLFAVLLFIIVPILAVDTVGRDTANKFDLIANTLEHTDTKGH